ncbi:MAG: GTPase HflX [Planctomycetota bacterium]
MMEIERKQGVDSESTILVGVQLAGRPGPTGAAGSEGEDLLDELTGLAESAGAQVVGRLTQRRESPDIKHYIGKGKLQQLAQMVSATEADVVIFDNDLSPAQVRNLEQETKVKVLDRTELILDIFSTRARTHEARLAVELAQLEYSLPRLKRMWTHLSRLKMGVGMRGPGEKQLETDRRLVEKRISDLKAELGKVLKRREREVAARTDRMTVSLVGYTNAGKSTLLNRLTGAGVYAEDQLFATLDTRTRRWKLPGWGPVLLSDTVGFIRDLPHKLIASFKATLEEARQANLLLHVADASNPQALDQIQAVYRVLEELEIDQKDTLLVLNKVDRVADPHLLHRLEDRYPNGVKISAATGAGIDALAEAVSKALSEHFLDLDIEAPTSSGKLLAYLAKYGEVFETTYDEDRVRLHVRLPREYAGRIDDPGVTMSRRDAPAAEPSPAAAPVAEASAMEDVA